MKAYVLARNAAGKMYVSVPAGRVPAAKYKEDTFIVAGSAEPLDARSDGKRLLFCVDDGLMATLIKAGGYQWAVAVGARHEKGTVVLKRSAGKAFATLRDCSKPNGGK